MKISAKIIAGLILLSFCSCSLQGIHTHPKATPPPAASITLTSRAPAYDLDKVAQGIVGFYASIRNESAEIITIAHPSMCLPGDGLQPGQVRHFADNHGKSEILLRITKPDGTDVILRDGWLYGFDPGNVHHFRIPPGGTQRFHLGWFFLNARGRWENDAEAATVFMSEGTYKVRLTFRNALPWAYIYNNDTGKAQVEPVWTGEMQSEEVAVDIN